MRNSLLLLGTSIGIFFIGLSMYLNSTAEQVVPSVYIGPDSTSGRESFMIACLASADPARSFNSDKHAISLCHAVSVELYGIAGFVYVNRIGEKISMVKPCIKAGSPEERKVCGK